MWGGGGIDIGSDVMIGSHCAITSQTHDTRPDARRANIHRKVMIARNVWIGSGSIILPGISIGENSVIAAGSVVTKDVPDNVLVAGVPAKVLKSLRVVEPAG
jgi:acetyltransferase-like isoleucine patch superfamily enzyme